MAIGHLKPESYALIEEYLRNGLITYDQAKQILIARGHKQTVSALNFFHEFNSAKISSIWMHVIKNVWKGVYDSDQKATVFNEYEGIFFRELLKNNGQMTRKHTVNRIFSTGYLNDKTASNLEDMGIIDIFRLTNYEVLYSINLNFMQEVKDG